MVKILVYGTLRKDLINYQAYLNGKEPLSKFRLKGFKMYDLGGYPIIVRSKDDSIVVEEYDVDNKTTLLINLMETGAGYRTSIIKLFEEEHYMWVYSWIPPSAKPIKHGDYCKYLLMRGFK